MFVRVSVFRMQQLDSYWRNVVQFDIGNFNEICGENSSLVKSPKYVGSFVWRSKQICGNTGVLISP